MFLEQPRDFGNLGVLAHSDQLAGHDVGHPMAADLHEFARIAAAGRQFQPPRPAARALVLQPAQQVSLADQPDQFASPSVTGSALTW